MQDVIDNQPVLKRQRASGLGQFAIKLCVSAALALGLLATGEYAAYFLTPRGSELGEIYDYQSYVIWRVARSFSRTMTVDETGHRRTYYSHCGANEYTIWLFGGSGLWGSPNKDWETIPSFLAKIYEESGRRVCVRNYGEPGWASTQEIIGLLQELKHAREKPDVVLFYDGTIDSYVAWESGQVDVHYGFPIYKQKFESWRARNEQGFEYLRATNTHLALEWIAKRLQLPRDSGGPASMSAEEAASGAQRVLDNYLKNMELLDVLAAHYGFDYVCFWEPLILVSQKPLTAAEESVLNNKQGQDEMLRAAYQLVRNVNRPHLVYLGDLFRDRPETIFVDRTHLTLEGNRLVAERIYEVMHHPGF